MWENTEGVRKIKFSIRGLPLSVLYKTRILSHVNKGINEGTKDVDNGAVEPAGATLDSTIYNILHR